MPFLTRDSPNIFDFSNMLYFLNVILFLFYHLYVPDGHWP